jgi:site-specific recombinase XerD
MQKTEPRFTKTGVALPVSDLARFSQDWLLDGEIRQHSKRTLDNRRRLMTQLLWFFQQREFETCGTSELRAFLAYLSTGHEKEEGRWGNPHMKRAVRPRTVHTYYGHLRTFFRWLVDEELIEASPMENLKPPLFRSDQIQPFSDDQIQALISAAKRSNHPRRDTGIVLFLLDTGIRASELCSLRVKDVDMQGQRCTVMGKGNKTRVIYFGRDTRKTLWTYLKEDPHESDEPLFLADRGTRAGEPLTRSGLFQLVERLVLQRQVS